MSFNYGKSIKLSLESHQLCKEAQAQIQAFSLQQQVTKLSSKPKTELEQG